MERISDKKINDALNLIDKNFQGTVYASDRRIADAQLAADKKELDRVVEQTRIEERKQTLRDLRDMWTWEAAHGHPCYSVDLDRWIKFCREAGVTDDWWELRLERDVGGSK